ncbi:MAG: hypothetical protein WBM57_00465 [Woeseiaceae bacterium]
MKKLIVVAAGIAAFTTGCASQPDKIGAAYVSPLKYKDYDCEMIALERASVERKTNQLHYKLKQEANKDAGQMAVGMVLFWPALFFLEGGDGPEAAEYAQLKGEYVALEDTSNVKKCELDFADDLSEAIEKEDA